MGIKNRLIKTAVRKSAQAAAWLPALNLKFQSIVFFEMYKATDSSLLESTSFTAEKWAGFFKRFAEGKGPPPGELIMKDAVWCMSDMSFGMADDLRTLSHYAREARRFLDKAARIAHEQGAELSAEYERKHERKEEEHKYQVVDIQMVRNQMEKNFPEDESVQEDSFLYEDVPF